jgi:hypothetical protein
LLERLAAGVYAFWPSAAGDSWLVRNLPGAVDGVEAPVRRDCFKGRAEKLDPHVMRRPRSSIMLTHHSLKSDEIAAEQQLATKAIEKIIDPSARRKNKPAASDGCNSGRRGLIGPKANGK